ncbi:hypothetical protein EUX98_g4197 [Antrodiella citrinella]|uniref:SAM-dependent MTase RsmB/NOP-type domain-containing protein n=1 Tax=Antrodiella citrinella TaxID=2447956 RepID=A0A4S4MVP5_9APHY|nr:hypothetical protein EUX98_g4197 [Antrodiella citrinella]
MHTAESESTEQQDNRLNKLAGFQLMMIRHAMKFPSVQRIVYSTCSIHATENEHVVRAALKSEECASGRFKLGPRDDVLPTWHRRGLSEEMDSPEDANSLVRCSPGEDATNGFFVSLFVRETETLPNKRKAEAELEAETPTEFATKRRKKKKKKVAVV